MIVLPEHTKRIDLNEKKTEAEWATAIDNFWIKATPHWFEWLEWIIVIGVFTFLAKRLRTVP